MSQEKKSTNLVQATTSERDTDEDLQARHDWIATYAYFLAEARGFTPVDALEDWLEAERAYMERGFAKRESD